MHGGARVLCWEVLDGADWTGQGGDTVAAAAPLGPTSPYSTPFTSSFLPRTQQQHPTPTPTPSPSPLNTPCTATLPPKIQLPFSLQRDCFLTGLVQREPQIPPRRRRISLMPAGRLPGASPHTGGAAGSSFAADQELAAELYDYHLAKHGVRGGGVRRGRGGCKDGWSSGKGCTGEKQDGK